MSTISGISGNVNTKSTVRKWSISSVNDLQAIVASNTAGATTRLAGNEDWSGQYDAYGHTPESLPGEALAFVGCIDATRGATGTAIVDEITVNVDIEGGTPIEHTVKFSGNGVLTLGAITQTPDVTEVIKHSSIGCKCQESDALGAPSFSEIDDIRSMSLTLTSANQAYQSSDTAGGTRRLAGNIDFSFEFTRYIDDPDDLIDAGTVKHIKMFVSATEFWELEWVRFGDASGIDVDRESGAIVGATQSGGMEGYTDLAGTMTQGSIVDPAVATFWP